MTSKRKLRAEIERLRHEGRKQWYAGYCYGIESHDFACGGKPVPDHRPWAAHLARVTDAAREQGKREGWSALAAEVAALHRRDDESPWCDHGVGGWPCPTALLVAPDLQPQPETTPEPVEPPADEFAGMAFPPLPRGLDSPTPGYHPCACGFACRCATIPSPWTPGSVTR